MSSFSWQGRSLCWLSLVFIKDLRVVRHNQWNVDWLNQKFIQVYYLLYSSVIWKENCLGFLPDEKPWPTMLFQPRRSCRGQYLELLTTEDIYPQVWSTDQFLLRPFYSVPNERRTYCWIKSSDTNLDVECNCFVPWSSCKLRGSQFSMICIPSDCDGPEFCPRGK